MFSSYNSKVRDLLNEFGAKGTLNLLAAEMRRRADYFNNREDYVWSKDLKEAEKLIVNAKLIDKLDLKEI